MTWRSTPAWNFAIALSVAVALFGAVPASASLFGFLPSIFGSRTPTPATMPPPIVAPTPTPTPAPPLASYMAPGQATLPGQPAADTLQPLVGVLETQPKTDAPVEAPPAPVSPANVPTQTQTSVPASPEPVKDTPPAVPVTPAAPAAPATTPAPPTTPPPAATNEKCKDKYPKAVCDNYRTYGYCHSQRSRLVYYCERTCGYCSDECFNDDETCTQSQYQCDEAKSKIPTSSCKALCGGCKLPELHPTKQVLLPVIPASSSLFGASPFSTMAKKLAADMAAAANTASTLPEMDEIDERGGKPFASQWPFFGHDGLINNGEWEIEVTEERRI